MLTLEEIAAGVPARVAAGAAWLDEHRPGWVAEIDVDDLDMGHPYRCVLGQLYDPYDAAPLPHDEMPALGFYTVTDGPSWAERRAAAEQEYELLDAAWERLILARRGGAS